MWQIVPSNAATVVGMGETFRRDVSDGTQTVSYWFKKNGNVNLNNFHGDLHFTLGNILGGTIAYFHATWHNRGSVTQYTCTLGNDGRFAVDESAGSIGPNMTAALAIDIVGKIYRKVWLDEEKLETERVELTNASRSLNRGGYNLFANALKSIK
ncbi:MAG TPA: hypothetical protein VF647_15880 [Longimicrobium sp.]|jgi:hypothetical protein